MTVQRFDMELMEYRDGDATFEHERVTGSDLALVLPLDIWDQLGRPWVISVSVEAKS